MSAIRVLIVDDSVVVRRFVGDLLSAEPGIEVVGIASNGRIGLQKVEQVAPDLVILDVEMPEMDGLETLVRLRRERPGLPVIMYSSLTHRGAMATLDALEAGANDYVTKPAGAASSQEAAARVRSELVTKIRALVPRSSGTVPPTKGPRTAAPAHSFARPLEVLAIGASTGGPNALTALIPSLPGDFPAPILIVQHMPPLFTAMLAERLDSRSAIRVREAVAGDRLAPGCAWIAPGDHHMGVSCASGVPRIEIHRGPPENSCRPSVDVLFRSVASAYGPGALAVVLTGMGNDGLRGSERIREAGGAILAQDEATSVVWGMPGFVARAGLADRVLPLEEIAPAIAARARTRPAVGAAP